MTTRRPSPRCVLSAALGFALTFAQEATAAPAVLPSIEWPAAPAARGPRVVWTEISLPSRDARPDLERFFKRVVDQQTRRANWRGRPEQPIEARLQVNDVPA